MSTQTPSTRTGPARMPADQTARPMTPVPGDGQMAEHRMAERHMTEHRMMDMPARGTETKASFKTTEFWIYLIAVAGVLIASQAVGRNASGVDVFRADKAWWFISLLTIGYLGSRGLAKAGSAWRNSAERNAERNR